MFAEICPQGQSTPKMSCHNLHGQQNHLQLSAGGYLASVHSNKNGE